ncbi:MAG: LLM class flavin-dependent oxidoreductase, partial [Rhodospirillaceae bacterium]|nr:LLM class flavin-dependent oxidoreductase [Rhodospirillaceae bacterium]
MVMFHYFVNQPYLGYPHEAAAEFGAVMLKFSNRHFDPERAAALYARYHKDFVMAEQVGFDAVLVNEHHNAPAAMSPSPNISATVLAKITSRVKIFIGGNILPLSGNPVRLAEELAMIDLISKGRLISGFVRGGAVESLAHNANTVHNRELFDEAHALILKTWTQPGPFAWEGKHFHYRVVNPWVLPYQRPHPPIMVPGSTSAETVIWAAERNYPYVALATRLEATDTLFATYDRTAAAAGHTVTPAHHGYVIRVHVAPSDDEAHAQGRELFGGRVAQVTSMSGMTIHPDAG